jgi:hypothetical protein
MKISSLAVFMVLLQFLPCTKAQENHPLTLSKTIAVPQIQGGFNHMSADAEHERLFLTATGMKTVEIVNLASGKPERALTGDGPAAALFAPEFNQLYVTRGESVCLYDGLAFELKAKADLQSRLDELGYDPKAKRLYVGCMSPNNTAIAIVGIQDGRKIGEIKLPAKPQGFVVEQQGNRIFANMPTLNQIAVLDRDKGTVAATWPLKDVAGNYPIGLDETNHRLFVGCRRPALLLVLNAASGTRIASVPISEDTDDLSFDAQHQRIYLACGSGFIDVIGQREADSYALLQRIPTREGARNSCFSRKSSQLYLAVPERGAEKAEIRIYQCR